MSTFGDMDEDLTKTFAEAFGAAGADGYFMVNGIAYKGPLAMRQFVGGPWDGYTWFLMAEVQDGRERGVWLNPVFPDKQFFDLLVDGSIIEWLKDQWPHQVF